MLMPHHLERDTFKQSPTACMREKLSLVLIQFRVVVYDCSHLVNRMSDNLLRIMMFRHQLVRPLLRKEV